MVKKLPAVQEPQVPYLGQKDPLEKGWLHPPIFLSEKSHGQRSVVGHRPQGHKQ